MTYVLSVATNRNLDLAAKRPSELANVVRLCPRGPGYHVSQELAATWISDGIDSVVFPSVTGTGRNVGELSVRVRRGPSGRRDGTKFRCYQPA